MQVFFPKNFTFIHRFSLRFFVLFASETGQILPARLFHFSSPGFDLGTRHSSHLQSTSTISGPMRLMHRQGIT